MAITVSEIIGTKKTGRASSEVAAGLEKLFVMLLK